MSHPSTAPALWTEMYNDPARAARRAAAGDLLAPSADVAAVTLHAGDLPALSAYYQEAIGLTVVSEGEGRTSLGRGEVTVLVLVSTPGLPAPRAGEAGLFHTAILFPDQASLAATVLRAAQHPASRYVGSADHLVSEAFYFTDPEGNGIELYRDRPHEQWRMQGGEIAMATEYLDPNDYLRTHVTEEAVATLESSPAKVGHVHLQVGDVSTARAFYVDTLGFEVTTSSYPGALFVSAGGYHHHLGMNIWNSRGAGPRAATLGLGEVSVTVPGREDLDAVAARLRARGFEVRDDGASVVTFDPWRNEVRVASAAA